MRVLIACEESQTVCKAFRERGHEAYSNDILHCSGGHPEWHIKGDVIKLGLIYQKWDLVIAHPPCTRLTNSGVRWLHERNLWQELEDAILFFKYFINWHEYTKTPVCIENPIPHKWARDGFLVDSQGKGLDMHFNGIGKYDQLVQPWQFGHEKMKATCLWLMGLPQLIPTDVVGPPPKEKKDRYKWQDVWTASPGPERDKLRSKTYPGIAKAMAEQWG